MQMASSGARASTRSAANLVRPPNGARWIHLNPLPRAKAPQLVNSAWSRKLVSTTRTLLGQFFTHLTAPGLPAPSASYARAFHGVGARANTIQQRLSLPVRTAISRPMQGHYFPRAPHVQPRSVANVGLGSARNFSTGRAVFQNLANNVPVAGRAFYEADWDIKSRPHTRLRSARHERKAHVSGKQQMKATMNTIAASQPAKEAPASHEELDHYFPVVPAPSVTTYLLIPLPPTPTTRTPLPPDGRTSTSLLPLSDLITLHNDHEMQRLRVSSLFTRLDAANVWQRGVTQSAYAHSASIEGVCTILRVEFVGWTKAEVRSVIGESGTGWCVLEETCTEDHDDMSDASSILSGMSSPYLRPSLEPIPDSIDESLVLPSLDLSAAYRDASEAAGSWARDDMSSESREEAWTDLSFDDAPSAWADDSLSTTSNSSARLGFSFSFSQRSLQA